MTFRDLRPSWAVCGFAVLFVVGAVGCSPKPGAPSSTASSSGSSSVSSSGSAGSSSGTTSTGSSGSTGSMGSSSAGTGSTGSTGEVDAGQDAGPPCFIAGHGYDAGEFNPDNACQACEPAAVSTTWTNISNGTLCGQDQAVCVGGACESGCFISGVFYSANAQKAGNVCQLCDPSRSPLIWSDVPNSTVCGAGSFCEQGTCASGCVIAGVFYGAGGTDNNCRFCDPSQSTSQWSNPQNGPPDGGLGCAGPASTCIEGACQPPCNQDSDCPMDFQNKSFWYCNTQTDTCQQGCVGGDYCEFTVLHNQGGYCDVNSYLDGGTPVPECKLGCIGDGACTGDITGRVECCANQGKTCNQATHQCQ